MAGDGKLTTEARKEDKEKNERKYHTLVCVLYPLVHGLFTEAKEKVVHFLFKS